MTDRIRSTMTGALTLAAVLAALGGCAGTPVPPTATTEPTAASVIADGLGRDLGQSLSGEPTTPGSGASQTATPDLIASLVKADPVDVTLPPQPLPQLIDAVFGDILGLPYSLGAGAAGRTDIVSLRTAPGADKRDLFQQVQTMLAGLGLVVRVQDGQIQIVGEAAPGSPQRLGRVTPATTPEAARQSSLTHVSVAVAPQALLRLMTDLYPPTSGLTFALDQTGAGVTASGTARDVARADSVMTALDRPVFAGVSVIRAQPSFLGAESLALAVRDGLTADGYRISEAPSDARTAFVLAIPGADQVLVFAGDPAALASARDWISRLDRPTAVSGRRTFIYQVRNTEASALADLVTTARGRPDSSASAGQFGQPGQAPLDPGLANATRPSGSGGGAFDDGRVAVDASGNRIAFTGTAEAFVELRDLLVALDTPRPQVLVEVTIAEVTLTDETRAGLEWFFTRSMSNGTLSGGTQGGLGLSAGGLSLTYRGTDVQASFQAFASNNHVNILSRPRLVARSGDEARIQVGTDVPIITSRANSSTSTGGNTDILQTIQYRQTGVILRIRPAVYSDGRIDLDIAQEVSSQQPNSNATIASPLILNRNITTRLSLDEGATAVIGGLIDDSFTKANTGVPFLKDLPILGLPFRVDTLSRGRTELVVLVTPHILRGGGEVQAWAAQASAEMNQAFAAGRGWSYTLTPFNPGRMAVTPAPN